LKEEKMSLKIYSIVFAAAATLVFHAPAFADEVPGAGPEIASCIVSNQADPDYGSFLEIYQPNDANSSLTVVFGKSGEKILGPVDDYQFSTNKNSLNVHFGSLIYAKVPRGKNTVGSINYTGSNGPSMLRCDTSW
jgi:hypothetical protein